MAVVNAGFLFTRGLSLQLLIDMCDGITYAGLVYIPLTIIYSWHSTRNVRIISHLGKDFVHVPCTLVVLNVKYFMS